MPYLVLSGDQNPRYRRFAPDLSAIRRGPYDGFYLMLLRPRQPRQSGIALRLGALIDNEVEKVIVYEIVNGSRTKSRINPDAELNQAFPHPETIAAGHFSAVLDQWTIARGLAYSSFGELRDHLGVMAEYGDHQGLISVTTLPYVQAFEQQLLDQGIIKL